MTALSYLIKDGLVSREGCRLFEATCSVLRDTGRETLPLGDLEISIAPAQVFFKSVDNAWYIPKTIDALPKSIDSLDRFKDQLHMFCGANYVNTEADDGTALKLASTFLRMVRDTFKLIASSSASLRFLGMLGVSPLASRIQVLGLTKSAFTVYCAVHDIADCSISLFKNAYYTSDEKREKRMFLDLMGITGLLCSASLNGLGFLQATVGSTTGASVPSFGWNAFKLFGSGSALLANTIRAAYGA